jgi:hypothetical protein
VAICGWDGCYNIGSSDIITWLTKNDPALAARASEAVFVATPNAASHYCEEVIEVEDEAWAAGLALPDSGTLDGSEAAYMGNQTDAADAEDRKLLFAVRTLAPLRKIGVPLGTEVVAGCQRLVAPALAERWPLIAAVRSKMQEQGQQPFEVSAYITTTEAHYGLLASTSWGCEFLVHKARRK